MFNAIKISIIIPVYNVENFLERAIDSLLCQTHSNIEIILVDDGSSDNSGIICDNYAASDSRVRVIHSKNGGPSNARNIGLDNASGQYIMFMDSDDYIDCNMVSEMIKAALDNDADIVTVNFRSIKTSPGGALEVKENVMGLVDEIKTFNQMALTEIHKTFGIQSSIFVWNNLYKTDLIRKYALSFVSTKEVWSEDQLFNLCYYTFVKKAVYINKSYYNYCVRTGTFSRSKTPIEIIDMRLTLVRKLEQFIVKNNLDKQSKAFYYNIAWGYFTGGCLSLSDEKRILEAIKQISKENKHYYKRCLLNLLIGKSGSTYTKRYSMNVKQVLYFKAMVTLLFFDQNERPIKTFLTPPKS